MEDNWTVITQQQITDILARLDKLYHDLPFEYAGYALSVITDIEDIFNKKAPK